MKLLRLVLALISALLAPPAHAASISSSLGGTVSYPLLAPTGCTAPAYSFSGFSTSGLCYNTSLGNIVLRHEGVNILRANSTVLTLPLADIDLANATVIGPTGTSGFDIRTNNTTRWSFDINGHLVALTDGVYDIGASGVNRPRTLYLSGSTIYSGSTTDMIQFGNTGGGTSGGMSWWGGSAADIRLTREAAGFLSQRDATVSQGFRIYGVRTDASNYERLSLSDDGANSIIASEAAGTGVAHDLVFRVNGSNRWRVETDGELVQTGSAPTVGGSCGTGPTIAGQDSAGKVTTGTGSPTSCTVTFAVAKTNAPACVVSNETSAVLARATSTTTTVVLAGSFTAGDVLSYVCMSY